MAISGCLTLAEIPVAPRLPAAAVAVAIAAAFGLFNFKRHFAMQTKNKNNKQNIRKYAKHRQKFFIFYQHGADDYLTYFVFLLFFHFLFVFNFVWHQINETENWTDKRNEINNIVQIVKIVTKNM